jgi:hypothetical protein
MNNPHRSRCTMKSEWYCEADLFKRSKSHFSHHGHFLIVFLIGDSLMPLIPWKPYLTNCSLFHSIEFNLKLVLVDSTFAWLFLFELMEINLLLWCVMERWLIECTLMCPMEWSPVGLCFIELISMHSPLACFKFRVSYLMYRLAFKCTFVEFSTNWYWISFQIHSFSEVIMGWLILPQ